MMRKAVWIPVVLIAVLLLTACGAAKPPSTANQGGENFMLALPRMVVDVDQNGNPGVFGLSAAQVGAFLGTDLATLKVDPKMVKQMMDTNVQHLEMRQAGDALVVLVNGKPMPHIGWSDATLQTAMNVAGAFGVQNADLYGRVLPLVRRLGLDLVMRFPRASGAAEIPLGNPDEALKISPNTDPPSAIAQMEIKYDNKGVPAVMGISGNDLAALGVAGVGQLDAATLDRLQKNNIQNVELRSKNSGMYVYVNGNPVPNVVWDTNLLKNAADLYVQMNPGNPNLDVMKILVPWIDKADVDPTCSRMLPTSTSR